MLLTLHRVAPSIYLSSKDFSISAKNERELVETLVENCEHEGKCIKCLSYTHTNDKFSYLHSNCFGQLARKSHECPVKRPNKIPRRLNGTANLKTPQGCRNMPPVAGNLMWSSEIYRRLDASKVPLDSVEHP